MLLGLLFGRDMNDLERRLRETPRYAGLSLQSVIEASKASGSVLAGTPEMIIEQVHAYEQAGAAEVMLQWLDSNDIDGLRVFAASVLPHL